MSEYKPEHVITTWKNVRILEGLIDVRIPVLRVDVHAGTATHAALMEAAKNGDYAPLKTHGVDCIASPVVESSDPDSTTFAFYEVAP